MSARYAEVRRPRRVLVERCRPDGAKPAVQRVLRQVNPDTILTFGSDGMTGHPDHVAVGRWVRRAWSVEGRRAVALRVTVTGSTSECKLAPAGPPACTRFPPVSLMARAAIRPAMLVGVRFQTM